MEALVLMTLLQECLDIDHIWNQGGGGFKILGDLSGMELNSSGQDWGGLGAGIQSQWKAYQELHRLPCWLCVPSRAGADALGIFLPRSAGGLVSGMLCLDALPGGVYRLVSVWPVVMWALPGGHLPFSSGEFCLVLQNGAVLSPSTMSDSWRLLRHLFGHASHPGLAFCPCLSLLPDCQQLGGSPMSSSSV